MNNIGLIKRLWEVWSKPNKKLDNALVRLLILTFVIWILVRSIF